MKTQFIAKVLVIVGVCFSASGLYALIRPGEINIVRMFLVFVIVAGCVLIAWQIHDAGRTSTRKPKVMSDRDFIMLYGSEEEKQTLLLQEMNERLQGVGGLMMMDMADGDFDGFIDWW